jgi:hypothetical protein
MAAVETAPMTETARAFFDAVDTGQGWEACSAYCRPDATFAAQADALAEIHTLAEYADWMKGMMSVMPDGRYEMKSLSRTPSSTRRIPARVGPFRPPGRARAATTST